MEALVTLVTLRGVPHEQARARAVKPPTLVPRLACTLTLLYVTRRFLAWKGSVQSVQKVFGAVFA